MSPTHYKDHKIKVFTKKYKIKLSDHRKKNAMAHLEGGIYMKRQKHRRPTFILPFSDSAQFLFI